MSRFYSLGEDDVRRFYKYVLRHGPDEWTELRAIEYSNIEKGAIARTWVNDIDSFTTFCEHWNGRRHIYAGVNPRRVKGGSTEDVSRITLIPIDVDAQRPQEFKKDAATIEELREATKKRNILLNWMTGKGLKPYIDFSGNGYRLGLLVDMPASEGNFRKLERLHNELNSLVGGVLDNISDPPRIVKVPGTWSIKGSNNPPRVHRLSKILQLGEPAANIGALLDDVSAYASPPHLKQAPSSPPRLENLEALVIRLRPCFRRFVQFGTRASTIEDWKPETAMRMALVEEAYYIGIKDRAQLISLFKSADDFSEDKTGYEVDRKFVEIKERGVRRYSCRAIKDNGGCIGPDCQLYASNITHVPGAAVHLPPHEESKNSAKPQSDSDEGVKRTAGAGTCLTIGDVDEALGVTIVEDTSNKMVLFFGALLNYTEEDQLNFLPVGPTSTGKTYLVGEILDLFPKEDVIDLGYASRRAFYHEGGVYETLDGQPIDFLEDYISRNLEPWMGENPKPEKGKGQREWLTALRARKAELKAEWLRIPKTRVQDFHQKLIYFLDMPGVELLSDLRPFLSHDKKRIVVKITNRLGSGGNATETITLLGYPTVIFLTASYALDGQEQTRLVQLSPEISPKKFDGSISLISKKLGNRGAYRARVDADEKRQRLKELIISIKMAGIRQIIIPEELMAYLESKFRENHPVEALRAEHQREYPRLVAYVKASALFHISQRTRTADGLLYATREDVDNGFKIYGPFLQSNESGLPPAIYQFWVETLSPSLGKEKYLKRQDVARLYYEKFRSNIGEKALKHLILLLLNSGLIVEDTHPEHGSVKVITTRDVDMETLREQYEERRRSERLAKHEDDRSQREAKSHQRRF